MLRLLLYLQAKQSFNETVATRFVSETFVLMRPGRKLAIGYSIDASKSLVLSSFIRMIRGPPDTVTPGSPRAPEGSCGSLSPPWGRLITSLEETSGLTHAWEGAMKSSKLFKNTLPDI